MYNEAKKKYIIIVQGEGRGHLTQALAVEDLLLKHGHIVQAVLIGKSARRQIPSFFYERIQSTSYHFESPNFWFDHQKRAVNIFLTIFYNLLRCRVFFKSIHWMNVIVKHYQPDIILNFYDLVAGLYVSWYRPSSRFICIGHHYWMDHPDFQFPDGKWMHRWLLKLNNHLTSRRADSRLALSFFSPQTTVSDTITVVPPLLRRSLFRLQPTSENFVLVYILNDGYAHDIIQWHRRNPGIVVHCFWDRKDVEPVYTPHPGLTFHALNDDLFLDLMSRCNLYVSTAGFESVCEAFYFNKPIILIPTRGHFEQYCNAYDAARAGVATYYSRFNFVISFTQLATPIRHAEFVDWVNQSDTLMIKALVI